MRRYKNTVRFKSQKITAYEHKTGGRTKGDETLTDLEERALVACGREVIDGNGHMETLDLAAITSSVIKRQSWLCPF